MASTINRITNANIYANGVNLVGRAEEVELPQPKLKMIEHKGLGLFGSPEFAGGLEKMEAKIKWSSLYTEVLAFAFQPFAPISLMVRADMQQFVSGALSAALPVVALMTATFKEMPSFKIVRHENSEVSSAMSVTYYKLSIAAIDQVEIDVIANIYKVLGIDQLAQFRANIGA